MSFKTNNYQNNNKYEVLAPAGSYKCMIAAFNAGADAVYLGGNMFGARASATNFTEEEIINAIEYAHLRNKKIFLTINTLLKNNQIKNQLYEYIKPLYEAGLDAVIVQDFGVMNFIKEKFKEIDIHASTQMTVTGPEFAKELKKCGVKRIVPARELSLDEISAIFNETDLEIECFVHGALCYCYSGMCLLSSIIGGRSGNRGRCAQPCRLPYDIISEQLNIKGEYPLSPSDLCTLHILPDILEAGVYSLKIEGRMKKPEYVASVVSMYRKYVDMYQRNGRNGYVVSDDDIRILKDIYNRGEFTDGYYKRHNGSEIMSTKRPNHTGTKAAVILNIDKNKHSIKAKALEDIHDNDVLEIFLKNKDTISVKAVNCKKNDIFTTKLSGDANIKIDLKEKMYVMRTRNNMLISDIENRFLSDNCIKHLLIGGSVVICKDSPVSIDVWYNDYYIHEEGAIPDIASNRPITYDDVKKQILKTGGTDFIFNEDDLSISVEDGLFISIKTLNDIRRKALLNLKKCILESQNRGSNRANMPDNTSTFALYDENIDSTKKAGDNQMVSVYVSTKEQFDAVVTKSDVHIISFESDINSKLWNEMIQTAHNNHKSIFMGLPYIFRKHGKSFIESNMDFFKANNLDGYIFRNMEEICYFDNNNNLDRKKAIFDNTIYGFNDKALEYLSKLDPYMISASFELNSKELIHLDNNNMELCIYGNIPVMISAGCIMKTYGKCNKKPNNIIIKDRLSNNFICSNNCTFCYNVIYNSKPLVLFDAVSEIRQKFKAVKYLFTTESAIEVEHILNNHIPHDYTRGHFKRGVE